ncbi:hypothetical protein ACQUQU_03520 [Thalassolituus sp. LLYu03]|uniref:hypothetical protein n=1 Tax=Thalassolituus sp. LLYu03 TaxID=3421656 RepID=UPI003D2BCC62
MFRRLLMIALSLTLIGYSSFAAAACVSAEGGVQTQTLYAGQTLNAGSVTLQVIGDDLVVTYSTTDGWSLNETHLWVGTSLSDMPQTRKGTPKIGNFPYHSGSLSGVSQYTETIPLSVLGFSCPQADTQYYVAAHAVVSRVGADGETVQTETGWADGTGFVDKGMWGTYFTLVLTCDCGGDNPPVVLGSCETAFAYSGGTNVADGDITTSFLDIDEDEDGNGDFNRWGWTNGPVGSGSYSWDIYAGAGQSDISKGTLVGVLNVVYDGFTAYVDYVMYGPYLLDETHLYVGNEILPRNVNGLYTVAPGQYPTIHGDLGGVTSDTYVVSGLSGDIYVVAHGVSCTDDNAAY